MEIISALIDAIATTGFPAAMCIYIMYLYTRIEESHRAEVTELTNEIRNMTVELTRLSTKMEDE